MEKIISFAIKIEFFSLNTFLFLISFAVLGILLFQIITKISNHRWHHRIKSPFLKELYPLAIAEVVEACEKVGVTYWFTEGTLIGLLRYGAVSHPSREDAVDDDIDIMIEVENHEEWLVVKNKLKSELEYFGWGKLYERTTSSSKKGRVDKMQLWKSTNKTNIHVDLHSYFVNETHAFSHEEPNSYPFQYWDGKLPISMLYPMKKCLCYEQVVPCPNNPISILKGWNAGEYIDSNLAFPIGKISEEERLIILECSEKLSAKGYASMRSEIKKLNNLTSL